MKSMIKVLMLLLVISPSIYLGCSGDSIEEYKKSRIVVDNTPTPDNTPPSISSVNAIEKNKIVVSFNEEVDQTSAETTTNYHIQGNNRINVLSALLDSDGYTVILTVSTGTDYGMQNGKEYTLLVQRVADKNANSVVNAFSNFLGKGSVVAEIYYSSNLMPGNSPYPVYKTKDLNFAIAGTDVSAYQYSIDGGSWSSEIAVSSEIVLTNISEGYHTLKVAGKNSGTAEWQDVNYATTTAFIVDTIPPTSTLQHLPSSVSDQRDIEVIVNSSDAVSYKYRLNSEPWNPVVSISNRIIRKDLRDGDYTLQVISIDDAGNEESLVSSYSWTIAGSLPVAVINNAPDRYTKMRGLNVTISGNNVVYYKYKINSGAFSEIKPISESIVFSNLTDGNYLLEVVGYSSSDENSAGPSVTQQWTVDNVAPTCSLSNLPLNPTNVQETYIQVGSLAGDVVKYCYRVNDGTMSGLNDVSQALELSALPDGNYKLEVFGVDLAGNQQSLTSATIWDWTVDLSTPRVELENLPVKTTTSKNISITVKSGDVKAYKYLIDSGSWSSEVLVSNLLVYNNLSDGYHTVSVIGRDEAGNWQSLKDSTDYTWLIDTNPPTVALTDLPPKITDQTIANITVGGVGVTRYKYKIDTELDYGFEYDRYTKSTIELSGLVPGPHKIYVIGCDNAGNWQATSLNPTYEWTIDPDKPSAVLNDEPSEKSKFDSISVEISAVDAYKYKIDQNSWSSEIAVSNPIVVSELSEGEHVLLVIGKKTIIDPVTHDPVFYWQDINSPTTCTWTVDTTPPVSELSNLPDLITSVQTASIKVSGNGVHAYRYALDNGGISYGAQILISEDQYIDLASLGNSSHTLYVKGIDEAGNEQLSPTVYSWTVDTSTPTAELTGNPDSVTKDTSINITINGFGVTTYQYQLDGENWSIELDKSNKISRVGLAAGNHTINVKAKNAAGTWQVVPTYYAWSIDVTAPSASDIILDNLPANPSSVTTANITVSGSIVAYQYKLDNDSWSSEYSAIPADGENIISLSGLSSITHTLYVIGKDTAGNWTERSVAKTYSWLVDTVSPVSIINNAPNSPTSQTGIDLIITGTDLTEYMYKLDSFSWTSEIPISTHIVETGLSDGIHTILVKGKKGNGNTQLTPTEFTWTIDTVAPVAVLDNKPVSGTYDTSINIDVSGTDVVAYQYKIDGGNWLPDLSEKSADYNIIVGGLSVGDHTIYVRARDNTRDASDNYSNWQGNPGQPGETIHFWTIAEPPLVSPSVIDTGNYSNNPVINFSWLAPSGAADVKIQIASDSSFASNKIVYGGDNGISIGLVNGYSYTVTDQDIQTYYARVSVNSSSGKVTSDSSWKNWGTATDGIGVVGGVKGVIKNALTKAVLANVQIQLRDKNNTVKDTTTSDASGNFAFSNVLIGTLTNYPYNLAITASGYSPTSKSNITVSVSVDTDLGVLYIMPNGATSTTISGQVLDANDGAAVRLSTITIYDGNQNLVDTKTSSNADPSTFTTSTLPAGVYTMKITKSGYFDLTVDNIIVNGSDGAENLGRQAICQVLSEPQVRVVVLWGATPTDYDLHMVGPTTVTPDDGSPTNRFLIYWSGHKSYSEKTGDFSGSGDSSGTTYTASLVQDQTSGYGPESINLFRASGVQYARGLYTYTLRDFSNQNSPTATAWLTYPITMRVYDSQGLVREINFPSVAQDLNCWKAIKINIQGNNRNKRYINVVNQFGTISDSSKSGMDW